MIQISGAFGLTSEEVESLLVTAGRAPSLHNSQPWSFRVSPQRIDLHADPERRLPVVDPDGRELRIACGAALFNLRLALQRHEIRPLVTILPHPDRPDLIAAVRHGGRKPLTPELDRLLSAVPLRRTNRRPFSDTPVATHEQNGLRRAAEQEGGWLHVVQACEQRTELQRMAVRAHHLQLEDPEYRAELARWTAVSSDRRDGVPASTGGPRPEPQDLWVLRDFTGGERRRVAGKDFEHEPMIAVLTSHHSGPLAEVQVGQALQRVLLTATAEGLSVSFLSQIVEVPRIREELRRLLGGTLPPQAVLRIGRGWPVPATPRRTVADLLAPEIAPS